MSVAQRPSYTSVHGYAAVAQRAERRAVGSPMRVGSAAPKPAPDAQPSPQVGRRRPRLQTAWFALMLIAASVITITGLFYLSGHARIAYEGLRRARLVEQLAQERARNLALKRQLAVSQQRKQIVQRAVQQFQMAPATAERTLTLGEPLPSPKAEKP